MRRHTSKRPNGQYVDLRTLESDTGIAYSKLYHLVRTGKVRILNEEVAGRAILVHRKSFEEYLEQNTVVGR